MAAITLTSPANSLGGLRGLYFDTPAPQQLQARKPSVSERVQDGAANMLGKLGMNERQAHSVAKKLASFLNDMTPVGAAQAAQDAGKDYGRSNYLGAAVNALGALLSSVPDGGAFAHSIIAPLFHGSPHKFEKFALEKIGTGEGAQAYGHGLYFAENPAVATDYRQKLAGYGHTYSIDGRDFGKINDLPTAREAYAQLAPDLSPLAAIDERAPAFFHQFAPVSLGSVVRDIDYTSHKALPEILTEQAQGYRAAAEKKADPRDKIAELGKAIIADTMAQKTTMGRAGHLYEVQLDANPEDFLDWDAPFGEQPAKVQDAIGDLVPQRNLDARISPDGLRGTFTWDDNGIKRVAGEYWPSNEGGFYVTRGAMGTVKAPTAEEAQRIVREGLRAPEAKGMDIYHSIPRQMGLEGQQVATDRLNSLGIPGIRYLDQGSRTAGQGTHNYVVFDPSLIDILRRY